MCARTIKHAIIGAGTIEHESIGLGTMDNCFTGYLLWRGGAESLQIGGCKSAKWIWDNRTCRYWLVDYRTLDGWHLKIDIARRHVV